MRSFEVETYKLGLRNDLNLIYTMSNLIQTLTKIDTQESRDLAIMSAHVISKQASELMRRAPLNCEARDAAEAAEAQIDFKAV